MTGFSQSINLYSRLEPPKSKPVTLIYMGVAWGVLTIVYFAVFAWMAIAQNELEQQVTTTRALNQGLKQQISRRQQADELVDLAPIESRLAELKRQQQQRKNLVSYLEQVKLTESRGFSEAMAGLARQHIPGIAIEKFAMTHHASLSIQGQLGEPEALPRYVKRLGNEPVFKQVQFNKVEMSTANEQLSFEMSSDLPRGADS